MAGNLTAMIASIFSGSAVTADPYFEYTTLLLPGNGTNGAQNNTFLDASTNNFTITRNGNTTQGTFSPFSQTGWGNYFSGSSQYLSVADSTAFTMGTGDFTVEYWVYWNGTSSTFRAYGQVDSGGSSASISIRGGIDASNKVINGAFSGTTDYLCTSTASLVANTWNHIAFVRDGTTLRQYINGGQDGTASISTASVNDSSSQFAIGRAGEFNGNYFGGYISNFRLVKGRCVYPSGTSFTPPTSPLTRTTGGTNPPQGTETSLLTCQSNRFLDSNGPNTPASSPITITPSGSPSVQAFSPFNPTSSWSATTNGGSGYFDGTGDYLTAPTNAAFNLGTTDFTIEWSFYYSETPPAGSGYDYLFGMGANATTGIALYIQGGVPKVWNGSLVLTSSQSVVGFTWYHLALVRSSGTLTMYLNGTSVGSVSLTSNLTGGELSSGPSVGTWSPVDLSYFPGYISNFRIVKGTAIVPPAGGPTSPLTAVSGTSLLLNFTNAGIYDATSKNDLETVGNAQISTAISAKFGTGSMYFDGTGDYLSIPSSQFNLFAFNTGDFTLEAWIYPTALSGDDVIISSYTTWASSVNFYFATRSGSPNTLLFRAGDGVPITIVGNTAINLNEWCHVAVTRSSGVTRMFVNGVTQTATHTGSVNISATTAPIFVGANNNTAEFWTGYMQDVRITRGYARYTANFTAPTAAFPTL